MCASGARSISGASATSSVCQLELDVQNGLPPLDAVTAKCACCPSPVCLPHAHWSRSSESAATRRSQAPSVPVCLCRVCWRLQCVSAPRVWQLELVLQERNAAIDKVKLQCFQAAALPFKHQCLLQKNLLSFDGFKLQVVPPQWCPPECQGIPSSSASRPLQCFRSSASAPVLPVQWGQAPVLALQWGPPVSRGLLVHIGPPERLASFRLLKDVRHMQPHGKTLTRRAT